MRHARRSGFTFVELLTVMIIVGLLAGMSTVALRSITSGNRVRRASRLVATDLQYAFTLAASRRSPVVITFDEDSVRYRITNQAGDATLFTRNLGAGSQMQLRPGEVRFSTATLSVFPSGLAEDTLLVTITQARDTNRVWLARGGTTRIR